MLEERSVCLHPSYIECLAPILTAQKQWFAVASEMADGKVRELLKGDIFKVFEGGAKEVRKQNLVYEDGCTVNPEWFSSKTKDIVPADIKVKDRRHFIFALENQLDQLCSAKNWYLDGTFKLVSKPFTQFVTINVFVRAGECIKQVPLVCVVMSGKKERITKRFSTKRCIYYPTFQRQRKWSLGFEKAMCLEVKAVLPGVKVQGCVFHWTQALWRKVQALGLAIAYKKDDGTYKFVRRLMALPFLPRHKIVDKASFHFRLLAEETTEGLQALTGYIQEKWIESTVFPQENWSVYGQVHTNNDLQGYHNAQNRRASGKVHLPFYMLVQFLYKESNLVGLQIKLVSEEKRKRIQRKKYRNLQCKVLKLWEDYSKNERSPAQLLKACSVFERTNSWPLNLIVGFFC
ncbi:uncharacterized protein LOC116304498 [Actinia tenebrosa]|uniref:Uncharacterized protein LOC116304498 n=1 Tax=Actinia tenebrosa TaxID=6105 RepID=A0A6P8IVE2_ACTTE|nr:uncharacterized protein LOC116304498 [Actinia tenebrosa]